MLVSGGRGPGKGEVACADVGQGFLILHTVSHTFCVPTPCNNFFVFWPPSNIQRQNFKSPEICIAAIDDEDFLPSIIPMISLRSLRSTLENTRCCLDASKFWPPSHHYIHGTNTLTRQCNPPIAATMRTSSTDTVWAKDMINGTSQHRVGI
ncbi:hypothetical protein JAAARDRAFT_652006 [Jaapia argillacea MUCL 33604]|uniref:Uncharacterized protein n=1 Tax=Jaapia argillacea MUCL 33604 TaxID=933084 RepID=A0A067Q904_9AGAM|nr:hypothetical protein JAAARDRAFT_652006 [Jaapia argillacea MUCL 33604]